MRKITLNHAELHTLMSPVETEGEADGEAESLIRTLQEDIDHVTGVIELTEFEETKIIKFANDKNAFGLKDQLIDTFSRHIKLKKENR